MDGIKRDRRVLKTKRAIQNAFIKLLAEKDFNAITVKDIADEADIDRKTLYNHYNGIYEIRDELENSLIDLLEHAIKELDFEKNIKNPQHIFEILTDILNTNLELCSYLMKLDAHSHIVRKIEQLMVSKVNEAMLDMSHSSILSDKENIELCADFITSGLLAVYQHWFNSDRKKPLNEVSRDAGRLVIYGLKDFTEK